jgi:FixJ family two-component response regulator
MGAPALIHVVDDDESLRASLLELLDAAGFKASGYASTGEFLLHPLPDGPGCVLLDVRLPGPSGLELQAALQRQGVALPVIFLTGHADVPTSVGDRCGGLSGNRLSVTYCSTHSRALARDAAQRASPGAGPVRAWPCSRLASGVLIASWAQAQQAIADELGIRQHVKAYRAQLMEKLGVGSAAELGTLAGERRDRSA